MKTSVYKQLPSVLITSNDSSSSSTWTSQPRMRHVSRTVRLSSIVISFAYVLLNNDAEVHYPPLLLRIRLCYEVRNIYSY